MDLTQLEIFIEVAETKSFSETARQVHRAQSSVTRTIKQLETELGTRLFYRTTHTVELTKSGKLLVNYAKEMLQLEEKLKRNISFIEKTITGPLKVGASLTAADAILPSLFAKYQQLYPQVKLNVTINTSVNVVHALSNNEIHFGITEADVATAGNIIYEPFMEDELVIVVKPDHPTAQKDTITIEEIVQLPLIMREKGAGMRVLVEEMIEQAGLSVKQLDVVMELNATETIKKMTINGLGAAILSRSCLQKEIDLHLLKPLSIRPTPLKRHFYYAYREEGPLYPSIEALQELLIEMYGKKS